MGTCQEANERGFKQAKGLEKVASTPAQELFFDKICTGGGRRENYEEFEVNTQLDDDDDESYVSSCVGSCGDDEQLDLDEDGPGQSDEQGWSTMDETERNTAIAESLKHLGNVQKRPMSPLILKDGFGKAGIKQMKDVLQSYRFNRFVEK